MTARVDVHLGPGQTIVTSTGGPVSIAIAVERGATEEEIAGVLGDAGKEAAHVATVAAKFVEPAEPELVTDGGVPVAETRPTDRREGIEIPTKHVSCPFCNRAGVTEREINRCECGRWFRVVGYESADRKRVAITTDPDGSTARVTSIEDLNELLYAIELWGPEPEGIVVDVDVEALRDLPDGWRWEEIGAEGVLPDDEQLEIDEAELLTDGGVDVDLDAVREKYHVDEDAEIVFVIVNGQSTKKVAHKHPRCPRLANANGWTPKPRSVLFDDIGECDYCFDVTNRLRELGLDDRQIDLFMGGRQSVQDVFETIDFYGEVHVKDLAAEIDYSRGCINNALAELRKGFGIVKSRTDPTDARLRIYYVDDPKAQVKEEAPELVTDGGRPSWADQVRDLIDGLDDVQTTPHHHIVVSPPEGALFDEEEAFRTDGGRLYDCPNCGTVEDVTSSESDKGGYSITRCAECNSRVFLTDGGQQLLTHYGFTRASHESHDWRRRLFSGEFETVQEREERSSDRVVDAHHCSACGREIDAPGLCDPCGRELDDGIRTDGGVNVEPLLDVDVDEKEAIACLSIDPARHGWDAEILVENSREYVGDGVEALTAYAACYVHDPRDLRILAHTLMDEANDLELAREGQDARPDGGEDQVRSQWRLVCLDCDFEQEMEDAGHPRDGPPDAVEKRVRLHKHTQDQSHVVRVEGRLADRDGSIDPHLLTDGGVARDRDLGELPDHIREALPDIGQSAREAHLEYEEKFVQVDFEQRECLTCGSTCQHRIERDTYRGTELWECSICHDTREFSTDGGRSIERDRSPFRGHYRENGNRDPRGNGDNGGSGGHHGREYDQKCPFCGETVGNKLHQHLPCDASNVIPDRDRKLLTDGGRPVGHVLANDGRSFDVSRLRAHGILDSDLDAFLVAGGAVPPEGRIELAAAIATRPPVNPSRAYQDLLATLLLAAQDVDEIDASLQELADHVVERARLIEENDDVLEAIVGAVGGDRGV